MIVVFSDEKAYRRGEARGSTASRDSGKRRR
jgi:hypothetical protein